LQRR
jgi:hypothetical protein